MTKKEQFSAMTLMRHSSHYFSQSTAW